MTASSNHTPIIRALGEDGNIKTVKTNYAGMLFSHIAFSREDVYGAVAGFATQTQPNGLFIAQRGLERYTVNTFTSGDAESAGVNLGLKPHFIMILVENNPVKLRLRTAVGQADVPQIKFPVGFYQLWHRTQEITHQSAVAGQPSTVQIVAFRYET